MIKFTREQWIKKVLENENVLYHPGGRNQWGLDCIGAVIKPLNDLDIDTSKEDLKAYSIEGDGISLSYIFNNKFNQKSISELKNGDILLMKFFKHPQHVAIFLGDYYKDGQEYILHASNLYKKVCVHNYQDWKNKVVGAYSLKEFID